MYIVKESNNSFKSILKSIWNAINIFDIPQLTRDISCDVKYIRNCYEDSKKAIEDYKLDLQKEREARVKEQNLFVSVLDHLDDMVWAKDLEGRYIVANKAFREKFCYGLSWDELQGKNDTELAILFKRKVGHDNHTFGEVCANSDIVIQEIEEAKQFLEYGKINGSVMKLVVNKSPVYNYLGDMFATCGTGRNVTEWHDALEKAILKVQDGCSCFGQEETETILKELNRLKFEEGDRVSVR